ncbi:unnamed protein product, partial [Mesorhabditis spiculigera]
MGKEAVARFEDPGAEENDVIWKNLKKTNDLVSTWLLHKTVRIFSDIMLVLLIGDLHIPHRTYAIPPKFRKLLVPNKMQHVISTGNLCTRELYEYLRSLASDVHVVRGDFDTDTKLPETKVVTVGKFRIGVCHGHQIVPWNDEKILDLLARQLDVDVLVTGHSHVCSARERGHRLYIDPGSATGAFSMINDGPVYPSFVLLDVQPEQIVCYLYRLIEEQVKVDRIIFKKSKELA